MLEEPKSEELNNREEAEEDQVEEMGEIVLEEVAIDGICGVY